MPARSPKQRLLGDNLREPDLPPSFNYLNWGNWISLSPGTTSFSFFYWITSCTTISSFILFFFSLPPMILSPSSISPVIPLPCDSSSSYLLPVLCRYPTTSSDGRFLPFPVLLFYLHHIFFPLTYSYSSLLSLYHWPMLTGTLAYICWHTDRYNPYQSNRQTVQV